ncbi:excalibur calcium-binding domain-containing protein [Mannheimia varigena]
MAKRRKTKGSNNIGGFIFFMFIAAGLSKCMGEDTKDLSKEVPSQTQALIQTPDISQPPIPIEATSVIQKKENTQTVLDKTSIQNSRKENTSKATKLSEPVIKSSSSQKQANTSEKAEKAKKPKETKKKNIEKSNSFQCGGKRYCSQMNNCTEAKFYLRQCGVKSLDRDRDGVPCESICG